MPLNKPANDTLFAAASGAMGLAFFLVVGWRLLPPQSIEWILAQPMDPPHHYMGWLLFRQSPWTFPPGMMTNYGYPLGVSVTYVDIVPLLAFPLKLLNPVLPQRFQFFGLWLALSVSLQGTFGYLLARRVLNDRASSLIASAFFIASPIAFFRFFSHIALAGHWIILACLWLVLREDGKPAFRQWLAILLIALLVHPYLFIMAAALLTADLLRLRCVLRTVSLPKMLLYGLGLAGPAAAAMYLLGIFNTQQVAAGGYGLFSMNVNAVVNGMGNSAVLPNLPQQPMQYEGFNHLGLGIMSLLAVAAVRFLIRPRRMERLKARWPLLLVAGGLTFIALSNRVFIGPHAAFMGPGPSDDQQVSGNLPLLRAALLAGLLPADGVCADSTQADQAAALGADAGWGGGRAAAIRPVAADAIHFQELEGGRVVAASTAFAFLVPCRAVVQHSLFPA